ncbi:phosphocholine cytidylyltransferase family protein [Nitrosarchaeum sp.]|uniref:phosphocholine cytidylyltransferase family protein n=1 Tax=Nitrosarchaeum sp. TaxID=2026886 RepID=UPI00247B7DEF|nr:phosphocholine cytidylyltransferase family protein [Nitrosarchaeum sp.]MCV0411902.1 phosphocholine cytidylyltransferase family protein [Nitrosarchaeum sp.]
MTNKPIAIILAAGEGRRLRPLTVHKPKCLVKLFGKSILEYQIECFKNCGINNIIVVTGYLGDSIRFPNIIYLKNKKFHKTNMMYSLFCAEPFFKNSSSIIVSYGDIIFEERILKKLLSVKEDFSVVIDKNWKKYWNLRFVEPLSDAESLKINKNGYITDIGKKVKNIEEINGQYIGLMKFQGKSINKIRKKYDALKKASLNGENIMNPNTTFEKSFMTDFLMYLINSGEKIKAVSIKNGWLELDSINDYKLYNKMYKNGNISRFFRAEK